MLPFTRFFSLASLHISVPVLSMSLPPSNDLPVWKITVSPKGTRAGVIAAAAFTPDVSRAAANPRSGSSERTLQ